MSAKQEELQQLDSAFERFRDSFADVPLDAYDEVWLGDWDLNHLLAHMSGWWRELTPAFARVASGERPTPAGVSYEDADAWNEKFTAEAKQGEEALQEFLDAYAAYRAAADTLDEDLFGMDPEKGRPRIGSRLLQGVGFNHFEEHQDELAEWVKSRAA